MQNPPPDPAYQAPAGTPGSAHGKSSTGLDANIAAGIAYLFGWVSGLIFFLIEKESRFVRFHAMQSLLLGAAFFVLWIVLRVLGSVPVVGLFAGLLGIVVWLAFLVLWIICLVKAFTGKDFRIPVIGDYAANIVNK
jgi:uncharacterized membrane protein